jgi:hypothetical protein
MEVINKSLKKMRLGRRSMRWGGLLVSTLALVPVRTVVAE